MPSTTKFDFKAAADALLDESADSNDAANNVLTTLDNAGRAVYPPVWRWLFGARSVTRDEATITKLQMLTDLVDEINERLTGNEELDPVVSNRMTSLTAQVETTFAHRWQHQSPRSFFNITTARANLMVSFFGTPAHTHGLSLTDGEFALSHTMESWMANRNDVVYEALAARPEHETNSYRLCRLVSRLQMRSESHQAPTAMATIARRLIAADGIDATETSAANLALTRTVANLMTVGHYAAVDVIDMIDAGALGKKAFRDGLNYHLDTVSEYKLATCAVLDEVTASEARIRLIAADRDPSSLLIWLNRMPNTDRTVAIATRLLQNLKVLPLSAATMAAQPMQQLGATLTVSPFAHIGLTNYAVAKPYIQTILDNPWLDDQYTRQNVAEVVAHFWPASADELVKLVLAESALDRTNQFSSEMKDVLAEAIGNPDTDSQLARVTVAVGLAGLDSKNAYRALIDAAIAGPSTLGAATTLAL